MTADVIAATVARRVGAVTRPCATYTTPLPQDHGFVSCQRCGWAEPEHVIDRLVSALTAAREEIAALTQQRDELQAEVARLTAERERFDAFDTHNQMPVSFASVMDSIDSRHLSEAVETLVFWHRKNKEAAEAQRDALLAALREYAADYFAWGAMTSSDRDMFDVRLRQLVARADASRPAEEPT